jgi:uncharacterized delta-60 repeat protein
MNKLLFRKENLFSFFILVTFEFCLLKSANAQSLLWYRHFDNGTTESYDYVCPVEENPIVHNCTTDTAGNIYICGATKMLVGGGGQNDIAIVKYNSAGTELWHKFFPDTAGGTGTAGEYPVSIGLDDSSNVYVAGIYRNASAINQMIAMKYNSSGDLQWTATFDTGGYDMQVAGMAVSKKGNVYLCGNAFRPYALNHDIIIRKYNRDGEKTREVTWNGNGATLVEDSPKSIEIDEDENVYVIADGEYAGHARDFYTVKFDSTLVDSIWARRYNAPANSEDFPLALHVDASHNVYVTGKSMGSGTYYDFATVKYDSLGTEKWVKRFDRAASSDYGRSIDVDAAGNVYVTGESQSGSSVDYETIKYNSSGTELWARTNSKGFYAFDVKAAANGDVYVTGYTDSVLHPYDMLTVRYNSSGTQTWQNIFDDSFDAFDYEDEEGWQLLFDKTGNLIVYGQTRTTTGIDLALLKFDVTTGLKENILSNEEIEIFPNPSTGEFKIQNSKFKIDIIEIINVLGENVFVERGNNCASCIVHCSLDPGIYFVKIFSENKIITKKLIIQ